MSNIVITGAAIGDSYISAGMTKAYIIAGGATALNLALPSQSQFA